MSMSEVMGYRSHVAPYRGEPRLHVARKPRGSIVMVQFGKSGGGDILAPRAGVVKAAVAVTTPTLLVVSPGIRAEQDAPRLQGLRQLVQDPR